PWALVDDARGKQDVAAEARQKQRVRPDQEAGGKARTRPTMRGASPVEAADQARQELRHAAEGDESDRGQRVRIAAQLEIEEAEEDDEDDARASRAEDEAARALRARHGNQRE